ncbi:14429_t:CDS:2 [Funneliformis geosporum]|nr:14429_t:CDS:2 [Funneliformis geosporum]
MKNNALIFINKKLGVINYELSAKLEQSKLLYRSFCQISRSTVLTDDDAMLNADDIKQHVVNYTIENGRNEAARHFELDSNMVSKWI